MKKVLFIALGFVVLAVVASLSIDFMMNDIADKTAARVRTNTKVTSTEATRLVPDGSTIPYTEYLGHSVELHNDNGKISVRVWLPTTEANELYDEATLDFLKLEVERLTDGYYKRLGETNHMFLFTLGYPIWAPGIVTRVDGSYRTIYFADLNDNRIFDTALIVAHGQTMPPGQHEYYPYRKAELPK